MSSKIGHWIKIPGLMITWPLDTEVGTTAELSAQFNRLTDEEQSFLDSLES
jgi:hypothetical protein